MSIKRKRTASLLTCVSSQAPRRRGDAESRYAVATGTCCSASKRVVFSISIYAAAPAGPRRSTPLSRASIADPRAGSVNLIESRGGHRERISEQCQISRSSLVAERNVGIHCLLEFTVAHWTAGQTLACSQCAVAEGRTRPSKELWASASFPNDSRPPFERTLSDTTCAPVSKRGA